MTDEGLYVINTYRPFFSLVPIFIRDKHRYIILSEQLLTISFILQLADSTLIQNELP